MKSHQRPQPIVVSNLGYFKCICQVVKRNVSSGYKHTKYIHEAQEKTRLEVLFILSHSHIAYFTVFSSSHISIKNSTNSVSSYFVFWSRVFTRAMDLCTLYIQEKKLEIMINLKVALH